MNDQVLTKSLTQALAEGLADKADKADNGDNIQRAPKEPHPLHIVETHLAYLERIVTKLRSNAAQLETEIAERATSLRQTRASIEAFTLAVERLRP